MIIATQVEHDQAKLLRWKLGPWLSSAFKASLTRIIHSHTDDAELASEEDRSRLAGFCKEFTALLSHTAEADDGEPEAPPSDGRPTQEGEP